MGWFTDLAYLIAALLSAPIWLVRMVRTGKIRTDWPGRMGRIQPLPDPDRPRLLIHAVSVGEVNAIRALVDQLAADFDVTIAATTNTGHRRAVELFGPAHRVVRYPFDFTFAVRRFLRAVQPDLVALVELEVWPNFTRACQRMDIPVAVINGRLSQRSFERYRRVRPLVAPSFRRLAAVAAQDETIAQRFAALGVDPRRIHTLGTMKWDNALALDDPDRRARLEGKADQLAVAMGIDRSRPIVVAGSTGPTEEALIHHAVPPDVQLIIAPRKPERFNEAQRAIEPCVRRTQCAENQRPPTHQPTRFLLDTIGELGAAYLLADLVIVGRTFTNQHGSDMIEPVALGKPVIIGPDVSNFESVARALVTGNAVVQTTADQLPTIIAELLANRDRRDQLVANGAAVIAAHAGSVERHADLLRSLVDFHQS